MYGHYEAQHEQFIELQLQLQGFDLENKSKSSNLINDSTQALTVAVQALTRQFSAPNWQNVQNAITALNATVTANNNVIANREHQAAQVPSFHGGNQDTKQKDIVFIDRSVVGIDNNWDTKTLIIFLREQNLNLMRMTLKFFLEKK
ncbi:hypothetical protein C1645_809174 [Glomus cerebriforme]|uniref:Uncharacterized protein n=1 Tax=Glomus cerebriforme TaxID=658196 RepID=A0A397SH39_9GLOM|nr:hypothetical protein C1645_809174 [Glomus cerebriforme]